MFGVPEHVRRDPPIEGCRAGRLPVRSTRCSAAQEPLPVQALGRSIRQRIRRPFTGRIRIDRKLAGWFRLNIPQEIRAGQRGPSGPERDECTHRSTTTATLVPA